MVREFFRLILWGFVMMIVCFVTGCVARVSGPEPVQAREASSAGAGGEDPGDEESTSQAGAGGQGGGSTGEGGAEPEPDCGDPGCFETEDTCGAKGGTVWVCCHEGLTSCHGLGTDDGVTEWCCDA